MPCTRRAAKSFGTLYIDDPPAESTGDSGLHSPVNPMNGKFSGLSHVSFCYDKEQATTTTTEQETTTTTEQETTTTTTTTAGGVSPTTVTPGGELPRTGGTTGPMVGIGAAPLAGGAALVGFARLPTLVAERALQSEMHSRVGGDSRRPSGM